MAEIYFDSAATSVPCQAARDAFFDAATEYGNPSSLHKAGMRALELMVNARRDVADALCVTPEEVIFTAGGTEGNNTAVFGLAEQRKRHSLRIVTDDSQHPSVAEPLAELEKRGFEIITVGTVGGELDLSAMEKALSLPTSLVCLMQVNNETGAHYDLKAARQLVDRSGSGALIHCDAVQGFLKVADGSEIKQYCDTASVSAHKIGGFKGVGALYVKKGLRLKPYILGGGQEKGLRSGTENVPGICAFSAAARYASQCDPSHTKELFDFTSGRLAERLGDRIGFHIPKNRTDHILSVSVFGVKSEVMLNALSEKGIFVSAGSACSSKKKGSRVLKAFGLSDREIDCTLRISFGPHNTQEECALLCDSIAEVAARMVK